MTNLGKTLRYTSFILMVLFGLLGVLFVAGYTFEDPGGWAATGLTALWVVPLVALSILALRRPAIARSVLIGLTAVVAFFTLADSAFGIIPRDDWGPVAVIAVFSLGVALACLGLHRAAVAGQLMIALATVQLVATLIGFAGRGAGERPGPGAMLSTSSGVVILPIMVAGILFLVAGRLDREPPRHRSIPRVRPTP